MKLIHPLIDKQIVFTQTDEHLLVVENQSEFFNLTKELYDQHEGLNGNWVLSDVDELNIAKKSLFIYDFYSLSCNSKKIQNLLINELCDIATSQDFLQQVSYINQAILQFNDLLLQNTSLNLAGKDEFTVEDIIKLSSFHVNEESNLLDRFMTYIDLFVKLKNINLVVLVNSFAVFDCTQVRQLLKQFHYWGLKTLFIEPRDNDDIFPVPKIIIDKDLCVL